jgi:hypothetical protein
MGTNASTGDTTSSSSSAASSTSSRARCGAASTLTLGVPLVWGGRETMGARKGRMGRRPRRGRRVSSSRRAVALLTLTLLVSGCGNGASPGRPVCIPPSVASAGARPTARLRGAWASVWEARPECQWPTPGSAGPHPQPGSKVVPA